MTRLDEIKERLKNATVAYLIDHAPEDLAYCLKVIEQRENLLRLLWENYLAIPERENE